MLCKKGCFEELETKLRAKISKNAVLDSYQQKTFCHAPMQNE